MTRESTERGEAHTSPLPTSQMRELLGKTTPHRWRMSLTRAQLSSGGIGLFGIATDEGTMSRNIAWVSIPVPEATANLEFIAAAHNSMPAYLDRIEALEHAVSLAETILNRLPSNGEHWSILQRFGAAVTEARSLSPPPVHGEGE